MEPRGEWTERRRVQAVGMVADVLTLLLGGALFMLHAGGIAANRSRERRRSRSYERGMWAIPPRWPFRLGVLLLVLALVRTLV